MLVPAATEIADTDEVPQASPAKALRHAAAYTLLS